MSTTEIRFTKEYVNIINNYKTKKKKHDMTEFTIRVTMKNRWIPHFLAMLKHMQQLGNLGSSRLVSILSDGDGDFRPKFDWDKKLPSDAKPRTETKGGDRIYDAG